VGGKRMDPRKQFSKWLARIGAIYWVIFLSAVLGLMYLRPETAGSCVYLVLIVTVNKMLDTIAYTDNSKTEKIVLAALERTSMELRIGGKGRVNTAYTEEAEEPEMMTDEEEEGENG